MIYHTIADLENRRIEIYSENCSCKNSKIQKLKDLNCKEINELDLSHYVN